MKLIGISNLHAFADSGMVRAPTAGSVAPESTAGMRTTL